MFNLKEIITRLTTVERRIECLMTVLMYRSDKMNSTLEEIQSAIKVTAEAVANEKAEVQAALAEQAAQIQNLSNQIAAGVSVGSVITQEQLDGLMASIVGINVAVADIYNNPVKS